MNMKTYQGIQDDKKATYKEKKNRWKNKTNVNGQQCCGCWWIKTHNIVQTSCTLKHSWQLCNMQYTALIFNNKHISEMPQKKTGSCLRDNSPKKKKNCF